MSVYLETNSLRKLTSYKCEEPVCTSIFSIFELLSGITEKDFEIRKACLRRIKEHEIEIKGPMIDKLFLDIMGITDNTKYNQFAYKMIMDIYCAVLEAENYSSYNDISLSVTNINNINETIHALTWLRKWDSNISDIINHLNPIFENENKEYIKQIYNKDGVVGLAKHFWWEMYDARIDENRLSHAEAFVGPDVVAGVRQKADTLFSKYNFKLFFTAQAVIFAEAFFINGNTQNSNNPSDLLHLLYLDENDKFVSNDNIYQKIARACPDFKLIALNNEKSLADLNIK